MNFVERAQAMVARGQYQEAVKGCRLGLLASPTNLEGRLVLGRALVFLRRYDEVLAEMQVALEVEPDCAAALALRGEALLRKGDPVQALEVLRQSATAEPGDRAIAKLCQEAELASTAGVGRRPPSSFGDPAESMTKHYPAHGGLGALGAASPSRPTPAGGSPSYETPSPERLAIGDASGTMEIDPELDGLEMVEDDLSDPPIDPPIDPLVDSPVAPSLASPMRPALLAARGDSDVMELSSSDLLGSAAGSDERQTSPHLSKSSADEPTASYRRERFPGLDLPSDFGDDAPTVARDDASSLLGHEPELPTTVGADPDLPQAPRIASSGAGERLDPSSLQRSAAAIDDLFPDEASEIEEISELEVLSSEVSAPARSHTGDMQMIREGLDREPEAPGARPARARPRPPRPVVRQDATADIGLAEPRRPRAPPTATVGERGRGKRKKVDGVDRTMGVRRPKKRSPLVWVYLLLAIAVGAGSVYVGLQWRQQRRGEQVEAARRSADSVARSDTYNAYLEARRIYREIVELNETPATRAALARMRAATAAEFGVDRSGAHQAVAALGELSSADAIAARAYDAIARADADGAQRFAIQLRAAHGDDPMAPYLEGRALLLLDQPDKAAEAFRDALRRAPRPSVLVGLGLAEEARGGAHQAIAAFDRAIDRVAAHPAAVIHRARVAARSGQLRDGDEPERTLRALVDDEIRVSPEQKAWANMSLAEVELARGDVAGAKRALERARESRPPLSWPFTAALIRGLLRVGSADDARAETERAVKQFASRTEPRVFAAQVALDARDAKAALVSLEKAGDLSKNAEGMAIRGQAYLALGELAKAKADLDRALAMKPGLRAAQAAQGQLLLQTGNPKAAVDALAKIYDASSTTEVALTYAAALRQTGDKLEARSVLEALSKRVGTGRNGARVLLELARLERAEGRVRQAREYYAKAMQADPNDVAPRMGAALLALDTGDRKGAREAFNALVRDQPDNGRVLVAAARALSMSGAVVEAGALIERADKAGAEPWRLARERGRVLIKQSRFDLAVEPLSNSIGLEPGDGEARLLLLDAHLYRGNEADARQVLRDILKAFPEDAEAQLANGRIALFKERYKESSQAFKKARRLLERRRASARELADAAQWLGRVYYYDDKLLNARKKLTEAVALDASHAEAFHFLGLVELDSQRYKAATVAFRNSVAADPTSTPDAWFYLGESAYKARKWSSSRKAFKKYVELWPKGEFAADARGYLRRLK